MPDWTPERDRLLVSLWHRGDRTGDIAAVFKTTKNAVIGRTNKLKEAGWRINNDNRKQYGGRPRKNAP